MKKQKQKYRNGKTTRCPTKTFGHDRQCGFTLVELVIVIAIVIILSVISVPIYRGYVEKAKYSEGYALLGTVLSAQKTYYSEYGNFFDRNEASGTSYMPELGVDCSGNKYFKKFRVCSDADVNKYYFHASSWKPEELREDGIHNQLRLFYNITVGASIIEV